MEPGYTVAAAAAAADDDDAASTRSTAESGAFMQKFKNMLVEAGFPQHVQLGVSIRADKEWEWAMEDLEYGAFPILQIKASFLKHASTSVAAGSR